MPRYDAIVLGCGQVLLRLEDGESVRGSHLLVAR
jgi:hypothetical protein